MFVLSSDITIGDFRFEGVNDVQISHSLHSLVDTATIKIPAMALIIKNGNRTPENIVTANKFKDGDPVSIDLGYNGELRMEFKGFVKSKNTGTLLEIACEGYSWILKRNKVNISKKSIKLTDFLNAAIAGVDAKYPITIKCDLELELNNVQVNGTGLDAINAIAKYTDSTVTCFFIQPDVLWCGLIYTPYAKGQDVLDMGAVKYRLGYNVLKDNNLKLRTITDDPVEIRYSKKLSAGTKLSATSDAFKRTARSHSKVLNQLKSADALKTLANEKAYKTNYSGYEGSLRSFLEPFAAPGYRAYITDSHHPERDGAYIIESVTTHFGIDGAKRIVEIGPQIGFANR